MPAPCHFCRRLCAWSGPDSFNPLVATTDFCPAGPWARMAHCIATFVATSPDQAALAIVDTGTLTATLVPDSTITLGHGAATAQWTPDSAYVLFSGPGGTMHAYAPGSARAVSLDLKGSSSFAVG